MMFTTCIDLGGPGCLRIARLEIGHEMSFCAAERGRFCLVDVSNLSLRYRLRTKKRKYPPIERWPSSRKVS